MEDAQRVRERQLLDDVAIGWVDLVIERSFSGDELLSRMKGWVTVDVYQATDIIRQYGTLKILDDYDLVVETRDKPDLEALSDKLSETCGGEVWLEPIAKSILS